MEQVTRNEFDDEVAFTADLDKQIFKVTDWYLTFEEMFLDLLDILSEDPGLANHTQSSIRKLKQSFYAKKEDVNGKD